MLADILRATAQHALLVFIAVTLAIAIGLPGGIWIFQNRKPGAYLLRLADMVQTIPSLALFGLLMPLPLIGGIGMPLAVFALVLYALLPVLRNTVAGLEAVPPAVREAAVGLGLRPWEVLVEVDFPLAAPSIVAGIRIATVSSIGTATIAAAIGAGGLGVFLYRGLATVEVQLLLAGAIPAALLALLAEGLLQWIEKLLSGYAAGR
jgi:osmoprotectant transport system permease protein